MIRKSNVMKDKEHSGIEMNSVGQCLPIAIIYENHLKILYVDSFFGQSEVGYIILCS